jgi:hypothetical protein
VDRPGALGPSWSDGGVDRVGGAGRGAAVPSPELTGGGATERGAHGELN